MKKLFIAIAGLALLTTGCVSKKKYAELEARNKQTEDCNCEVEYVFR